MPYSGAAGAVRLVVDEVGHVLVEDAARVHRHHLHAAAHAQHRQLRRVGSHEQGQLPGVAVGAPVARARVRLGAVRRRVDVGAAADDQGVQPRHDRLRRAGGATGGSSTGTPPVETTAPAYSLGSRSARCCHTPYAATSR